MHNDNINAPKIELTLADKEYSDIRRYPSANADVFRCA